MAPDPPVNPEPTHFVQMRQLSVAYGLNEDNIYLDPIADRIIGETQIGVGNDKETLMDLLGYLVNEAGSINALESGGGLPQSVYDHLIEKVKNRGSALSDEVFVGQAIDNIRAALRRSEG
jgi:hypothetical protein